jgi:DNA-binding NtrC family response regulator
LPKVVCFFSSEKKAFLAMKLLIIGTLNGELAQAARIAIAAGARVDQTGSLPEALSSLRGGNHIDLVLCDLQHDVAALVRALAAERMAVPVVACGVGAGPEAAAQSIRDGAREFLPLPPDPELIAAILQAASGEPSAPLARDPVMLATLRRVQQIAAAEVSVLITGESGTGKEVIARHIHKLSRRSRGPFVALNCAAIPENLLESELFGHEKGAFSGAIARRCGKFEAAEGGTLLLDEISEMDIRLQAKLLRAIQEREIDRVGGSAPVRIDVRILATSNRDLPAEIAAGRFREDLYFRLNVVGLRLPPLRERRGDIEILAAHYARHYAGVNGVPPRLISREAMALLTATPWRGNVRELENLVHRAVLLAEGPEIMSADFELSPQTSSGVETTGTQQAGIAGLVGRRVDDVERQLIIETLSHTLGNRTHAATILGISIRALRNKLRDYAHAGIAVPPPHAGTSAAA